LFSGFSLNFFSNAGIDILIFDSESPLPGAGIDASYFAGCSFKPTLQLDVHREFNSHWAMYENLDRLPRKATMPFPGNGLDPYHPNKGAVCCATREAAKRISGRADIM
jgi:hypothetical protein